MKLKNSHILLIVMAIFLLVSIGSVCASDMADDAVGSTDNVILGNDSSTGNITEKIDTTVVSEDVKYRDTETRKIDVTVNDNESKSINIAKENITVTENKTNLNFTYSNNSITLTDKLATGNHTLIIKYLGNDNYKSSTKSILLSIFGNYTINVPTSVNVNSTKLVKVTTKVTNGVDSKNTGANDFIVTLSYKEGNDTKIVKISDLTYDKDTLVFTYNLNETITSSNMTIIYKNGTEEELSKTTKLNRIYNAKIEALNTKNEYKNGEFTFKLVDIDNNNAPLVGKSLTLYVGSNIKVGITATTDSNGIAAFKNSNLYYYEIVNGSFAMKEFGVGKHTVDASTSSPIVSTSLKTNLTVEQARVTYSISNTGVITVKNKLTGEAVAGAYIIVTFDKSKNKVIIGYTDKDGKVKITTVGKHHISVKDSYNGEDVDLRYTGSTVAKTITNKKITAKCSAPKLTTYYKADKTFDIKLTNNAKNPIYDAKLKVKVYISSTRYYEYTGTTGLNGQIRLYVDSLKPGTYKVEVTSGDTKSFALKKVTSKIVIKKAPTKLTPTKLTAKKGVSKYFKVTVKNTKTKKVISGVKVKIKVYTGKKFKTYTVKTNKKGIAQINVKSLKVGTHKVVVTSANKYCVAKAAKSTIKITKK